MPRIVSAGLLLLIVWLVTACSPTATEPPAAPAELEATRSAYNADEPLPILEGEFRSDPAYRVAATGRPQLIEFYADT